MARPLLSVRDAVRVAAGVVCVAAAGLEPAGAVAAEPVTEIRVRENVRTSSETVRAIAGLGPGAPVSADAMGALKARLLDSKLFSDAHAFWEPTGGGARVTLIARDRAPWVPLPTGAYYPGNLTGGLGLVHRNLLGADIEASAQGRLSTVDSGAEIGLAAPRLLAGWLRLWLAGELRRQTIAEHGNTSAAPEAPLRVTGVTSAAAGAGLQVMWLRRYVTGVGYRLEAARVGAPAAGAADPAAGLPAAAAGGARTALAARVGYDDRAVEGPLRLGAAVLADLAYASPRFGGDRGFEDLRLELGFEHGRRVLRRHNFVARASGLLTWDAPLWHEAWLGGFTLRGVSHRRHAGDSRLGVQVEHHVPLLSPGPLLIRGLVFADAGAIFWGRLPRQDVTRTVYDERADGRRFLPSEYLEAGFQPGRDLHASLGAGLRAFLDPVSVPLVGVDAAYVLRDRAIAVLVTVGR
jgi:hypothetical protein